MPSTTTTRPLARVLIILVTILFCSGVGIAQSAQTTAAKEYRRLVALSSSLRKIPIDQRQNREPHRSFLKRNDKDIVYSEPAGSWYVRSDRFWDLQKKYSDLPIADQIAWTAAENPLPGECEGYAPCHFSVIRMTYGEYLRLYPKGKYSRPAVRQAIESLTYLAEDAVRKEKNYEGPGEASDRAEFIKAIDEMRSIFSRVTHPEAAKALSQLKVIEEGFK